MDREISINKKFIVIMLLVSVITLLTYYSYALFQITAIKENVIVIVGKQIHFTTTISGETNPFTLAANQEKELTITITRQEEENDEIAYKMYYTMSGTSTIEVKSSESFQDNIVKGTLTTTKTFTLKFKNTGSNSVTITLGAQGGLTQYPIDLDTGRNEIEVIPPTPSELVLASADAKEIATPACANKTRDTSDNDGITYISGTATCIDFNYVWYSGKLWRITAIYEDGSMKMITDNMITSIAFNESTPYYYTDANTTSYMYQWLNEDFLDTLYNYENIIVHDSNTYWNATMPSSTTIGTKPAEKDSQTDEYLPTMIPTSVSPVGLLNSYEYYKAFRNATTASNYLNIRYNWWLLEPYYSTTPSSVRYLLTSGGASGASPTNAYGARPSVILQSGLSFAGSGSKTDPYRIVGDMSSPILGTTKVNERAFERNNETYSYNGEYVKIKYDNELSPLYRIVGIETDPSNNTKTITKLVAMDYADNRAKKNFATSSGTIYGSGDTIDNANNPPTTWYSYFHGTDTIVDGNPVHNNGWFDNLSYKSLLTSGTYYMGNGDTASQYNYKGAICASPSASVITRTCTKTANTNTFNVGLLRYGEMFATQQKTSTNTTSINMWLITQFNSSFVRYVIKDGDADRISPTTAYGARPSIHLISDAKFLTCSTTKCDGTEAYPYEVGL